MTPTTPDPHEKLNIPATIDLETVFQLYVTLCGDAPRVAHAVGLTVEALDYLAEKHGWKDKIRLVLSLRDSDKPGDLERGVNRAYNFVQAYRLQKVIERTITRLYNLNDGELDEYILPRDDAATIVKRGGKRSPLDGKMALGDKLDAVLRGKNVEGPRRLSTRALADLASALEKTQALTYAALGDTAPERAKRTLEARAGATDTGLHQQIAEAMAEMRRQDKALPCE